MGYSFDRGAEVATGGILILMGSDVFVRGGSVLNRIIESVKRHPNEIGCATCLGLSPGNLDMDAKDITRRYGADIKWTVGTDDLPPDSKLRRKKGGYTSIIEGQWRRGKDSDKPYIVSCLMGAFYWCSKEFYQRIHGFDTEKGNEWQGHKRWACLEPFLSIKAQVYGGAVRVYPDIEVGHVFGRKTEGARSADFQWWNRYWVAHTMLEEGFRQELLSFPRHEWNKSVAEQWIRLHQSTVQKVRERNQREGKLISKP